MGCITIVAWRGGTPEFQEVLEGPRPLLSHSFSFKVEDRESKSKREVLINVCVSSQNYWVIYAHLGVKIGLMSIEIS